MGVKTLHCEIDKEYFKYFHTAISSLALHPVIVLLERHVAIHEHYVAVPISKKCYNPIQPTQAINRD